LHQKAEFPILDVMPPSNPAQHNIRRSSFNRTAALSELGSERFDILVIGGGIAGACAAWDASLRGLRVALIERADFGGGTSAQSLKVLHGGIRYLQHLDIARLNESCRERAAFLRIAPHLTRPLPFALPAYGAGMRGKAPLRAAFGLLNLLTAGRNNGIDNRGQHIPRPFIMSRSEFLQKFPAFDQPDLTGAGVFYDGQIGNPARVVFSIVRSAHESGAVVANYCAAEQLLTRAGKVEGVTVRDQSSGGTFDIRARVVANLTGPFAPTLHQRGMQGTPLRVPLSRDMALVVNRKLLPGMALGVQTRYRDPDAWLSRGNRHIFMVPWRDFTLIGVNSKVYEGDPYALTVTEEEIQGFLEEIQEACPALGIARSDVAVVNAGLLPFGENQPGQKDLSFGKRSLLIDHAARGGPEGLITGMSVRWTMGRLLGEKAIDLACQKLQANARPSSTATTAVFGGLIRDRDELIATMCQQAQRSLSHDLAARLADTFGTVSGEVLALPDGDTLLPDGRTLAAEIRYVARNEMSMTLADIVLRRLDLGTGCTVADATLSACARIAGEELGWDAQRQLLEVSRVRTSYPFASPASQECRGVS
jgi:glycerol-3-phosphate dehydrogenase